MPPRIALQPTAALSALRPPLRQSSRRTFLPSPEPQVLTATRTLPYPHTRLYELIANVDSYANFVPYCTASKVTHWSAPDSSGRRWPVQADLRVGFGGFEETFTSRLLCVPGYSVEAVSGDGATTTGDQSGNGSGSGSWSSVKSLVTRWAVRPCGQEEPDSTEVNLSIRFQFTNPLYSAVSAAVSDKVAATMIEAFEKRAARVLGASNVTYVQQPTIR